MTREVAKRMKMLEKFKVGDWYRNKHLNKLYQVNGYEGDFHVVIGQWVQHTDEVLNNFELWVPKEGEWCWFWNNKNKLPTLTKFDFKTGRYWTSGGTQGEFFGFEHCEPFIGQLPTHLKEN